MAYFVSAFAQQALVSLLALFRATCSSFGIVEKRTLCARVRPLSVALGQQNSFLGIEGSTGNECDGVTIHRCCIDSFDVDGGVDELFERSDGCDQ